MAQNVVQEEYYCTARTQESCRKEYLSTHRNLKYVRVAPDGNCFFRSIAAYYRRNKGARLDHVSPAVVNPRRYHQLRRYIVHELGKQIRADYNLQITLQGMYNDPKKPHKYNKMKNKNGEINIEKILSKLAKKCKWKLPVFEMMVLRVPSILNINLILYKVEGDSSQYYVTKSVYRPDNGERVATTISIFLESFHYGLVEEIEDDEYNENEENANYESVNEGENETDEENEDDDSDDDSDDDDDDEESAALIQQLLNENERNAKARKGLRASRRVKPSAKPVAKRSVSHKAKLSVANSQFNRNMRAAMEASYGNNMRAAMAASHVNNNNIATIERQFAALESGMKPSRRNQIASLQQQISQLELKKSVKKRPGVSRKNPVNNMSAAFANVSLRNRNNSFDCDKAKVPELREYLKSRGYEGPPPLYKINRPALLIMCRDLGK